MISISYNKDLHEEMLITWYKQWDICYEDINILPDTGLIIPNVCAVFLYKTNSLVCMIENLICNKDCNISDRQNGLDIISKEIIEMAKNCGFTKIISLVSNPSVINRCLDQKYTISEDKFHIMIRSFK